jgi:hypothetical protein
MAKPKRCKTTRSHPPHMVMAPTGIYHCPGVKPKGSAG